MNGSDYNEKPAAKRVGEKPARDAKRGDVRGNDIVVPADVISDLCDAQVRIAEINAKSAEKMISALCECAKTVAQIAAVKG